MAGMIKNIFGLNTQDVAEQRAELNRLKSAQRIKQGDIDPTVAVLGQQFGDMLGRGLMKKLGYEDTEMAQAEANEARQKQLQEDLSKLDSSSPEYFYKFAESIKDIDPVKAGQLAIIGNSIRDKNTKANKKESGKPFVPTLSTEKEDDLYSSIIEDSDFSGINNEKELITRIHNDLENYKDMWKKKQKKEGREDTWGGDKDAVLAILNQYKESGLIEKDTDVFGLNIIGTNKWEFKK